MDRPLEPCAGVTDADYRVLVESVRDYAIFMIDPEGRVLTWNAGAKRLKGYEADEIIGRDFRAFYPPDQLERDRPGEQLREAVRTGRVEDEGWRIRKDGSRFWASVVITALFDESGRHRGFAKVTRDLSEQRAHEELLRRTEERFRLMVESVRDYAIFMLDPQGRVATWNLGAQITKQYSAEEIIGRHFSVFYPPEQQDRNWPARELEIALREGRVEDEGWRIRKDGSRFWASVVITALYDGEGRHYGFAKVTRDLSAKRRIDRLEHQERQLHQFLATLGHELRNPLAPICNALAVMQMAPPESQQARAMLDILARQVGNLRRLVDDLLDIGRLVSGKVHIQKSPVRLQDVIDESLETLAPIIRERRHTLHRDLAAEPLWVCGDRLRLVQVVSNLLHNAAKFTPPRGTGLGPAVGERRRCRDQRPRQRTGNPGRGARLRIPVVRPGQRPSCTHRGHGHRAEPGAPADAASRRIGQRLQYRQTRRRGRIRRPAAVEGAPARPAVTQAAPLGRLSSASSAPMQSVQSPPDGPAIGRRSP